MGNLVNFFPIGSATGALNLCFWGYFTTQEINNGAQYDYLYVQMSGISVATYTNVNAYDSGWTQRCTTVNPSFQNTQVTLAFVLATDNSLITNFRVDDVSLTLTSTSPNNMLLNSGFDNTWINPWVLNGMEWVGGGVCHSSPSCLLFGTDIGSSASVSVLLNFTGLFFRSASLCYWVQVATSVPGFSLGSLTPVFYYQNVVYEEFSPIIYASAPDAWFTFCNPVTTAISGLAVNLTFLISTPSSVAITKIGLDDVTLAITLNDG